MDYFNSNQKGKRSQFELVVLGSSLNSITACGHLALPPAMSVGQPHENRLVEEIAQKKFRYEKIFEEQAVELRKDPVNCELAYQRVSRTTNTAKPGQQWMPKPSEKAAYMEHMDNICKKVPTSLDDRMEISFAAYAAIMCIVMVDIAEQDSEVQIQIMKRSTELNQEMVQHMMPTHQASPRFLTPPTPPIPLMMPVNCTRRRITAEDLKTLQRKPFQLVDKQFIIHPNDSERDGGKLLCQIVGVSMSKTEGTWYQVQFEGSGSIEMNAQEMTEIFTDSLLLGPASYRDGFGTDGISRLLAATALKE